MEVMDNTEDLEYAGFWPRVGASLVDTCLIMGVSAPLIFLIYGDDAWLSESVVMGFWDVILNYIFPAMAIILFWFYKSATPGKMAFKMKVVDAKTGGKPSVGQLVGRYFAYFVAMLPLFMGIIWVGIDKRKQGWHDKLAGTLVIRDLRKEPVTFETPVQD